MFRPLRIRFPSERILSIRVSPSRPTKTAEIEEEEERSNRNKDQQRPEAIMIQIMQTAHHQHHPGDSHYRK